VICDVLRDLACDVVRNEIGKNDDQLAEEAAQRIPMRAMYESEKDDLKTRQRHSFHKPKIFSGNRERASEIAR
jgi:hypothetical protein